MGNNDGKFSSKGLLAAPELVSQYPGGVILLEGPLTIGKDLWATAGNAGPWNWLPGLDLPERTRSWYFLIWKR